MSGFDRFNHLTSFASPPKSRKRKSSTRSTNSSERKAKKLQKEKTCNMTLMPLKHKTPDKKTDSLVVTRSTIALSRTNLEQKYDSPEKSEALKCLSCHEEDFVHPPRETSMNIDEDSEPILAFTQEEKRLEKLPQTFNTQLLNAIQSYKPPSYKRHVPFGGFADKFRRLLGIKKAENVKILSTTKLGQILENEQRIKVTKIITSGSRSNQTVAKFQFIDDSGEPREEENENLMSMSTKVYGEILKSHRNFIVRIKHSMVTDNVVLHHVSHLRAF